MLDKLNTKHVILSSFFFKIIICLFFISPYYKDVYLPFLTDFSLKGYTAWLNNQTGYPYSPLLTIILFIFNKISSFFSYTAIKNLIYHLPILIADYAIFYYLRKFFPKNLNRIIVYYLFSPILIYASYIFSQHDLIPTALIFVSCFYLSKKRYQKAFYAFGLGIAIKWHIIVVLPLLLLFVYRKTSNLFPIFKYILISLIPTIIFLLPFGNITSALSVFKVNEGSLIFESYLTIKDLKVYLFPFFYSLTLLWVLHFKRLNTQLLMGLNAIIFLLFTVVVYPNPAWFIWSLPFIIYSFVKNNYRKKELISLYVLYNLVYLGYFIFLYKHPISGIDYIVFLNQNLSLNLNSSKLTSISFTLLVSLSSIVTYLVYISAIRNSIFFKRKFNAFLIGIAGDSGSGKTTLLNSLNNIIGLKSSTTLEGDGEHKWERGDENWKEMTHLNPKANHLHQQLSHLINLKKGRTTHRSNYNHNTGKFDKNSKVLSKDFIVIAGLHPFYLKGARENIDFKIFIDPNEDLRRNWKVTRDIKNRNYTQEKVLAQILAREEDSARYITPQKEFADLVIKYDSKQKITDYTKEISLDDILVKYTVSTEINLDHFIEIIHEANCEVIQHDYEEDFTTQSLKINHANINTKNMIKEFSSFFEDFEIDSPLWDTGIDALNQAMMIYCIQEIINGAEIE